jgi:hypothetical protein
MQARKEYTRGTDGNDGGLTELFEDLVADWVVLPQIVKPAG